MKFRFATTIDRQQTMGEKWKSRVIPNVDAAQFKIHCESVSTESIFDGRSNQRMAFLVFVSATDEK